MSDDGGNERALKASYVMRAHVILLLDRALVSRKVPALLVKGAALASTVYSHAWRRGMGDIDILVRRSDRGRALDSLLAAGWQVEHATDRPLTAELLEATAYPPTNSPSFPVEIHLSLDKAVLRPIDLDEMFSRGTPVSDCSSLILPSPEDHVVLVCLHLVADELRHELGFDDLQALLQAGFDAARAVEVARTWRAETALYLAFRALHLRRGVFMPLAIAALEPRPVLLRALDTVFDVRGQRATPPRRGVWWMAAQALVWDDQARWVGGVVRYGLLRAAERAQTAFERFSRRDRRRPRARPPSSSA